MNWDSFNVGKIATVNFNQPNANDVTLNSFTAGDDDGPAISYQISNVSSNLSKLE